MFKPNAWCACSLPCRILWGPPKLMGLKSFPSLGFRGKQKPQPRAISKKNHHKPWDSRCVEIPLILASACSLLNFFVLGNVTCEQFSSSNILRWAHASVDQFAVLLDLWTCETALLEKNARYRYFSWTENGNLLSVHFRLRKVPFKQHFPRCIHTDVRVSNCGWWYRFQMHWVPGAGLGAEGWSCWVL